MLEEMTRVNTIEDFTLGKPEQLKFVPRELDLNGATTRTWPASAGSNPPTAAMSLSPVTETNAISVPNMASKAPSPAPPLPPRNIRFLRYHRNDHRQRAKLSEIVASLASNRSS